MTAPCNWTFRELLTSDVRFRVADETKLRAALRSAVAEHEDLCPRDTFAETIENLCVWMCENDVVIGPPGWEITVEGVATLDYDGVLYFVEPIGFDNGFQRLSGVSVEYRRLWLDGTNDCLDVFDLSISSSRDPQTVIDGWMHLAADIVANANGILAEFRR